MKQTASGGACASNWVILSMTSICRVIALMLIKVLDLRCIKTEFRCIQSVLRAHKHAFPTLKTQKRHKNYTYEAALAYLLFWINLTFRAKRRTVATVGCTASSIESRSIPGYNEM